MSIGNLLSHAEANKGENQSLILTLWYNNTLNTIGLMNQW